MTSCSQCGVEITDPSKGNVCARCLVQLGLDLNYAGAESIGTAPGKVSLDDSAELNAAPLTRGQQFGEFEVLSTIGRGGMGMVYRAWQRKLNRIVALKTIMPDLVGSEEMVERFRSEARAAAALRHPNIVGIFDTGEIEGRLYIAMEFVEGQNLSSLAREQPLPSRRAAQYLRQISLAVDYAHRRGVLHRDLKPSNVLIDAEDQPRILDFGLAKLLATDSELTRTGQVLGSPSFMPPEQASVRRGKPGPHSDVYALGATLYCLLTARPPFQAETASDTVERLLYYGPVPPRELNASIPRDLETICLKCLEKEPAHRYSSAAAVAHDLECFLNNRPIRARPVSAPEKLWRWARRNPVLASLGAAVGLLTAAVTIGGPIARYRINAERVLAQTNATELRRNLYAADLKLAAKQLADGYYGRARGLLDHYRPAPGQNDVRGWEWGVLRSQCPNQALTNLDPIPSPVFSMDVSHDGAYLAVAGEGHSVRVYSTNEFKKVADLVPPGEYDITEVHFAHHENLLAFQRFRINSPGSRVVFWDVDAGHARTNLDYPRAVGPCEFASNDKTFMMAAGEPHAVVLLDLHSWKFGEPFALHSRSDFSVAVAGIDCFYSPDGKSIFTSQADGLVRVFNPETGKEKLHFKAHNEGITALAISPDGKILASAAGVTEKVIKLWDAGTGEPLGELRGHGRYVHYLAFSPRTNLLASASADETIRIWDVATRTERRTLLGHNDEVTRLAWSPDGRYLYSGAHNGEIYVWDLESPPPEPNPLTLAAGVCYFDASPDGSKVAAVRTNGAVCLCDLSRNGAITRVTPLGTANIRAYFSDDGTRLFAVNDNGEIRVWDNDASTVVTNVQVTDSTPQFVLQLPRNRLLVFDQNHTVRLWSEANGTEKSWTSDGGTLLGVGVSADGSRLAEVETWKHIRILGLPEYQEEGSFQGQDMPGLVTPTNGLPVALSPSGRVLALANAAGTLILWDVEKQRPIAKPSGDVTRVRAIAFSADGKRLATSGNTAHAVKVWDPKTGKELVELPDAGGGPYVQLQFRGNRLIGRNEKGDLIVWTGLSNSGQL